MKKAKQKRDSNVMAKSKKSTFSKKYASKLKDSLISAVISNIIR